MVLADPPFDRGRLGFSRFDHTVTPEIDPGPEATYFWAHQFGLEGGEGGYIGLQTRGNRADGSLGKTAIFSLWDATGADGPGVVRFSGEGTGWSARLAYPWEDTTYHLRVDIDGVTPDGTWWAASVLDLDTGDERHIGRLMAKPGWGGLRPWLVMWTEYYGPHLRHCAYLVEVSAVFGNPVADGGVEPVRTSSHVGDGTCDTTRITALDHGVRHEMVFPCADRDPGAHAGFTLQRRVKALPSVSCPTTRWPPRC